MSFGDMPHTSPYDTSRHTRAKIGCLPRSRGAPDDARQYSVTRETPAQDAPMPPESVDARSTMIRIDSCVVHMEHQAHAIEVPTGCAAAHSIAAANVVVQTP